MLDQAKQDIEAALDLMGNNPQIRDVIIDPKDRTYLND